MDVEPVFARGQRPDVRGTSTRQRGLKFVHYGFLYFQNLGNDLCRLNDTGGGVRFAQTWSATFKTLLPCPSQHDFPTFRRRIRVPLALGLHDGPGARIDLDGQDTFAQ